MKSQDPSPRREVDVDALRESRQNPAEVVALLREEHRLLSEYRATGELDDATFKERKRSLLDRIETLLDDKPPTEPAPGGALVLFRNTPRRS